MVIYTLWHFLLDHLTPCSTAKWGYIRDIVDLLRKPSSSSKGNKSYMTMLLDTTQDREYVDLTILFFHPAPTSAMFSHISIQLIKNLRTAGQLSDMTLGLNLWSNQKRRLSGLRGAIELLVEAILEYMYVIVSCATCLKGFLESRPLNSRQDILIQN